VKGLTGLDVPGLISNAIRGGGRDTGGGGGAGGSGGGGAEGGGRRRGPRPSAPAPAPAGAGAAASLRRETAAAARASAREAEAAATRAGADAAASVAAGEAATRAAMARADAAMAGAGQQIDEAARSAPAAIGLTRETTVNVAAQRLARDLAAVPGIERFEGLRLDDLDRAGPRPLRTMWRLARRELADRYGELTIGEIVDRFGGGSSPSA